MSKVTIEEIAQKADVSIATVSRIINSKGVVKEETKKKVFQVMEELQYTPKTSLNISNSKSKVILMFVPDFNNPFNALVIDGVQNSAKQNGYDVLLLQAKNFYTDTNHFTNIVKNNSIAGILILCSAPSKELLEELSFKCPVVMCSEYAENYGVSYVSIDDFSASKKAVNYLISTGCKKIGMINCSKSFKYARHREKGYLSALNDANLSYNPEWLAHISSVNYNLALSSAKHMLSLDDRPDAIFASSDVLAVAVIKACRDLNLNVPNDVSVVGFDNIELSLISDPQITTIEQPSYEIGFQALELLIQKINNPSISDRQVILNTELIVRGSTKMNI